MAETSVCSGMVETDTTAMKETLRAQQQLLQKLYAELDEEREASATATSEALDMILRLQGEKAAVKMEASHYKRMAEEKIDHAETTLEIFEELMYQKEMEIASLEFQVQAYRHKLISLGIDLNASEFTFPENLLTQRNDQQNSGENGPSSTVRRLNSLPPIPLKHTLRAARRGERSHSPSPEMIPKIVEESTDHDVASHSWDLAKKSEEVAHGTLDSYWNQIKKLDEKVKVISDSKDSEGDKGTNLEGKSWRSCSIYSQVSGKLTWNQTDKLPPPIPNQANHCEGTQPRKAHVDPSCSANVHDVFEVPQPHDNHKAGGHGKKRHDKLTSEADDRLTKPDSVSEEIAEAHVKPDSDMLKSMLSANRDLKIPNPKDMRSIIRHRSMDCNAQAEFFKLYQRIDRLERDRTSLRHEITPEGDDGEEQLSLLKDIDSRLKSIQSEIRSWKPTKAPPKDDIPLGPLQEAMLYFWL